MFQYHLICSLIKQLHLTSTVLRCHFHHHRSSHKGLIFKFVYFFAIVCFCFSICLCICVGVAPGQAYSHIGSTANATNKTKTVPAPIVHVFAKSYLKAKTDHKNGMSRFQSDCRVTKYPHTMVYTVFIVHFLCLSSTIAFQGGAKVGQICWELIMALLTVVQTDSLVLFKNKSPLGGPCPALDRSWLP